MSTCLCASLEIPKLIATTLAGILIMGQFRSYVAFVSGAAFMLVVLVVWLQCRLLPQQVNYETKLMQCESELAEKLTHSMNVSIRDMR